MPKYIFILVVALAGYWLSLSGYFTPMLLILSVISILLVLGLCARMKIFDEETVPYGKTLPTLSYMVWLGKEIVKANMQVVRAVLNPDMVVSPTLVKIPAKDLSDMGRTMFANSITLTPGTVSVEVCEDEITVHALLSEMSNPDDFAEMRERSVRAVNGRAGS